MALDPTKLTFGKYKNQPIAKMLRDRKYCQWFLNNPDLVHKYEYIAEIVRNHKPIELFLSRPIVAIRDVVPVEEFLQIYSFFHLKPLDDIENSLQSIEDKCCYQYYLEMLLMLENRIRKQNSCNIKAPTNWLINFTARYGLPAETFKEFLSAHDLPNLTTVVEDIKRAGGIEYKGAQAYKIALANSKQQELFWENLLVQKYGADISIQYKLENNFFDFVHLPNKVIYECKIGLKDFNAEQYQRYLAIQNLYNLVYLIGQDAIINLRDEVVYTTNPDKYNGYIRMDKPDPSELDQLLVNFAVRTVSNIIDAL